MIAIGQPKKKTMPNDMVDADATGEGMPDPLAENADKMNMDAVNVIHLSQDAYEGAQDGDEVSTTVSGKLMIGDDGQKHLMVEKADGKDVIHEGEQQTEGSPDEEAGETPDQESAEPQESSNDLASAKDKLMAAIKAKGGYNNAT